MLALIAFIVLRTSLESRLSSPFTASTAPNGFSARPAEASEMRCSVQP